MPSLLIPYVPNRRIDPVKIMKKYHMPVTVLQGYRSGQTGGNRGMIVVKRVRRVLG